MRRRLINLLSLVSLLLCVATVVLWSRSHWHGHRVGYRRVGTAGEWHRDVSLACMSGQFSLTRSRWDAPSAPVDAGWYVDERHPRPGYDMDGGLAGIQHRTVAAPDRWLSEIRIPMWAVALALAVPPALAARRWRRDRRLASAGLCPRCGYDLRATPERCPECGAAP